MNTWRNIQHGYKQLRHYMQGHLLFGATIAAANLYNIGDKREQDNVSLARYTTVSLTKGAIYSAFYPIGLIGLVYSACSDPVDFRTHLVPCSKYGSQLDRVMQFGGNETIVGSEDSGGGCPYIFPPTSQTRTGNETDNEKEK